MRSSIFRLGRLVKTTGLSLFLAGCSSAKFAVVNTPVLFSDVEVTKGVVFNEAHQLALDIYRPPDDMRQSGKPFKTVIFFHGGGWESGTRSNYAFVGERMAKSGYLTVVPDTRRYPEVLFPGFMHDAADAVAWVQANISKYEGDPKDIVLMGHSSGAHIAALVVADKSYLKTADASLESIHGVIGLAGPYDFEPKDETYKKIFSTTNDYYEMKVTNYIDGNEPPMLLAYGLQDELVGEQNLRRLVGALEAKGVPFKTAFYDDLNHMDLAAAFAWPYAGDSKVLADVLNFLKATPDS
ncbi:alpha/beta hydrolase [Allohahella marinimesophila]|uniref:Alpha/beta hydrolase n=1 Tax=Allohahella marinimesophila TaxID=1054972 RepID=A0ABP7Q0W2_9GAMM